MYSGWELLPLGDLGDRLRLYLRGAKLFAFEFV